MLSGLSLHDRRFMSQAGSPRLAHKAPVMQASLGYDNYADAVKFNVPRTVLVRDSARENQCIS